MLSYASSVSTAATFSSSECCGRHRLLVRCHLYQCADEVVQDMLDALAFAVAPSLTEPASALIDMKGKAGITVVPSRTTG